MTGSSNSDYQDMIVLDTYSDATGGDANALIFDKTEQKIRHYLADQSASTWGTPKTIAYQEDMSSYEQDPKVAVATPNNIPVFDGAILVDLSLIHI